jgi:transcription initiation factor TFIIIB Brf1 subunit/transcription initiation factor TFIIB
MTNTTLRLPRDTDTAAGRVPDIADQLSLSDHTEAKAIQLAERAWWTHPINAKRDVVAASAVYAASLLCNEKRVQIEVAGAAGVNPASIRSVYRRMLECEGIWTPGDEGGTGESDVGSGGVTAAVMGFIRGVLP